jgi:acetolactate synthase-1/2/3 large subunit
MSKIFDIDGAVLCEIAGVEDQNYIQMSHTKNLDKKIVQRPLEDQSPFLNRELFIAEMITKPIDQ